MSTLKDVVDDLRTELSIQLSLTTQFAVDYRPELEQMTALNTSQVQTMFRIRHQHEEEINASNTTWEVGAVAIKVMQRLSDPFDERAYTEAAMHTQQKLLQSREFWRGLTAVYDVLEGPAAEISVVRTGNVIRWSVLVKVLIVPT